MAVRTLVRQAGESDVAALAALEQRTCGRDAWSAALLRDWLAKQRVLIYVVERGQPLGYVVLHLHAYGRLVQGVRLLVDAGERRQGLGSMLVREARERCRLHGWRLAALVGATDEGLQCLLRQEGFRRMGLVWCMGRRSDLLAWQEVAA